MATIKDVARQAGVSVSTVSRVINNSGYVAKEVHKRVIQAMKELKYQPNAVARGLVSRKTATIGLIIPDVANPFFADIARGVEDEAIQNKYTVILCNTDWQLEREKMYIKLLRGKWAEGIVLVGTRSKEEEIEEHLGDLPVVLVDRKPVQIANSVWSDNQKGGYIATRHLIDIGCKKIVHISGPEDSPSAIARRSGFLEAIEEYSNVNGTIIQGDFRYDGGYNAAIDIFSNLKPPDGIFAGNDMMAIGVIQAASRFKVRIPDDVQLVGYDNIAMSQYVYPPLTTIDQPGYKMGKMALNLLLDKLENRENRGTQEEFPPKLIKRKSTSD